MKKVINGVLVNTQTNQISRYPFEYEEQDNGKTTFLPNMYALLNCDCIDIVSRKFGKHTLDIICDDEGLFKEDNKVSILTFSKHSLVEQLVGNVFICTHDEEGESISLSEEQIISVGANARLIDLSGDTRKVLVATL